MFLRSLTYSKLFYNCGTWSVLSKAAHDKFSLAYHRSFKTIMLHKDPKEHVSNLAVRAQCNMPSIDVPSLTLGAERASPRCW